MVLPSPLPTPMNMGHYLWGVQKGQSVLTSCTASSAIWKIWGKYWCWPLEKFRRTPMCPSSTWSFSTRRIVYFSSWIGVQQDLKWESTTSHPRLFLVETWRKFKGQFACWATLQPLLKLGLVWITNLIWCTPSVHLFIGEYWFLNSTENKPRGTTTTRLVTT